jgi:uncharacterized protein
MLRILSVVAAALLLAVPAGAQGVERLVPPSPAPNGFIADVAGVVDSAATAAVNARIAAMQSAGRGDIGVALLPGIGGYEPYEVGVAIYRDWGIGRVAEIGSAGRDLGALLLIVPKELAQDGRGHCWITTGRGAEGMLTDGVVAEICRDLVVPKLRERDYGGAILAGVDGIDRVLQGEPALAAASASSAESSGGPSAGTVFAWIGGVLAAFGSFIAGIFGFRRYRRTRPRRCPTCGGTMRRVDEAEDDEYLDQGQRTEERVKSVDYDVWICGACGTQRPERYAKWITSYKECPSCGAKTARTKRRVIDAATATSTGMAEDTTTCAACDYRKVEEVELPIVVASGGGSSGGGSSGGFSGGSSFGGSGATSGGGGGSSY